MKVKVFRNKLAHQLRRLPAEEIDQALDYYDEYFADLGLGEEDEVPEEFSNPKRIGYEILRDSKLNEMEDQGRQHSPWKILSLVLLTVLALPVGIPLFIVLVVLVVLFLMILVMGIVGGGAVVLTLIGVAFESGIWTSAAIALTAGVLLISLGILVLAVTFLHWVGDKIYRAIKQRQEKETSRFGA